MVVTNTRAEQSHPAPTPDANWFPQIQRKRGGRTTVVMQLLRERWQHPLVSTVVITRKYVSALSFPVHDKNKQDICFPKRK